MNHLNHHFLNEHFLKLKMSPFMSQSHLTNNKTTYLNFHSNETKQQTKYEKLDI